MSKKVRVTIELSTEFVKLLSANCQLSGLGNLREDYKQHTPTQALGVVVLLEARGALPEQVYAETPLEWRNDIQAIHNERKVIEDKP